MDNFYSLGLKEWIVMNLSYRSSSGRHTSWPKMIGIIALFVWKWRCGEVTNGEGLPLESKVECVRRCIIETEKAFEGTLAWQGASERDPNRYALNFV